MHYVFSTATCATTYAEYEKSHFDSDKRGAPGFNRIKRKVTINGGHGVATKHLFTPKGVMTAVNDDDMEFLLKNDSFQRHVKRGFMSYDKKKNDPEKKAANMADKDGSSPLTPKDFESGENSDDNVRIYKGIPKGREL